MLGRPRKAQEGPGSRWGHLTGNFQVPGTCCMTWKGGEALSEHVPWASRPPAYGERPS